MSNRNTKIEELKKQKKILEEQIKSANFKGYPEIKVINGKKYIYLKYKKYGRLSSQYAGIYTKPLYDSLKEMSSNIRKLKTELRIIKTRLAYYGFDDKVLSASVLQTMDYVRNNLKTIIYE